MVLVLVLFLILTGLLAYFASQFYVGASSKSLINEFEYKVNSIKINQCLIQKSHEATACPMQACWRAEWDKKPDKQIIHTAHKRANAHARS